MQHSGFDELCSTLDSVLAPSFESLGWYDTVSGVWPVTVEMDPGGHREQSASDDRVAPAAPYDPAEHGDPLHEEAP
eukprot:CAMPEP_0172160054 /NCGR_PEP_ID=MMETSP1050-20130122/5341_1 /TAXON_ID=233186 /ORGANISM="Cryptomonas curvata, Strain CCAP979/52" /LENGTH=75 /DNA_ID=CAMNT_0012829767 /DNA_START=262 /DNA_END=487 /DNA_ORIENTATION=+